jgi:low temperature requirement protein LtrA
MIWQTLIPVRRVRLWSADPNQSRRTSWLELFFDLIFVAAVAQVGVPLGENYSARSGALRTDVLAHLVGMVGAHDVLHALRRR